MRSVKISDLLDTMEAPEIGLKEAEAISPNRIKEIAMKKIHTNQTIPFESRKRMSRGVIAAIVAAACLALCGAGYAAGLFRQQYNWKGEAVGAPRLVETVIPQDKVIGIKSDTQAIQAIYNERADRELIAIQDAAGYHFSQRSESVSSMEELKEKLSAENSPIQVPYEIPEGYVLTSGFVAYETTNGYKLNSSEVRSDGLVVERYSAPPENDFISYYRLDYENEAGDRIFIFAQMSQESAYDFSAMSGESVESITIAGMDEALLHKSAARTALSMLQYLDQPISYVDIFTTHDDESESDPFTEIYYYFDVTNVDGEGLMQMVRP